MPRPLTPTDEMRERMARAVCFAMLGVEDRWPDWVELADNFLGQLCDKLSGRTAETELTKL